MQKSITSYNIANGREAYSVTIDLPSQCPHCHTGIEPKHLSSYHIPTSATPHMSSLFFCPACEMCFVGIYNGKPNSGVRFSHIFPINDTVTSFTEEISSLSPQFVKIYNQSEKAEKSGLDEICGMGYRKALEFLVKDFAIHRNPENEEKISKQPLSPCISENIESTRIKTLATASAWLGNDEAHYIRKHEDYDVNHLKAFIQALVSFINSDLEVDKATALLEKK